MANDALRVGLIIDPEFYMLEKNVAAVTTPLIRALCTQFQTRIIPDQPTYDRLCTQVDLLISMEPKWAAPVLDWRRAGRLRRKLPKCPCIVLMSDPHIEQWRQDYFLEQQLDYILGLYAAPFQRHFTKVPPRQMIYFPWGMPEQWLPKTPIEYHGSQELVIMGAAKGDAYNVRNWCRQQPGVASYSHSGVENKVLEDREYFEWLSQFDAVIAAGSNDPKYGLTTPKYFEIAAVGALLFAQQTPDLERLGFRDGENCVVFTQDNFHEKQAAYLENPADPAWLEIRRAGQTHIREQYTITHRLEQLTNLVRTWPGRKSR